MEEFLNQLAVKTQSRKIVKRIRISKVSEKTYKISDIQQKNCLFENSAFLHTQANSRKKKRRLRKESPFCSNDLVCEEKYSCPIGRGESLELESSVSEVVCYPKLDLMKTFSDPSQQFTNFMRRIDFETQYDLNRELEKLEEKQFSLRSPDNFALLQDHVTAQMRSILVNWLLEVNAQLGFKRETYYLTVSLLDRSIQQIPSILSTEFQLLGVVCLIISAKFEEIYVPKLPFFSHLTENSYDCNKIIEWENKVLTILKWRISSTTYATWGNLYMLKWDEFATQKKESKLPQFRNLNSSDFQLFREFYQILDIVTLSEDACRYSDRYVALSNLFLAVGLKLNILSKGTLLSSFSLNSINDTLQKIVHYKSIFEEFLTTYQLVNFPDLFESIQFLSCFYCLKFDYSSPKLHDKERSQIYEDFLQIQTFNPNTLNTFNDIKGN